MSSSEAEGRDAPPAHARAPRVRRRVLLRGAAAAPAAATASAATLAGVGAAAISAEAAWARAATALSPHAMATLVRAARDIFPHDRLGDAFYVDAVRPWDAKAAADGDVRALLEGGVARLDADARARHGGRDYLRVGWEADRVALLQAAQHTPFFKQVRADLVVSLYNQPAVWPRFGYEGSSAEHGGYLARGFDDIDWLPTA